MQSHVNDVQIVDRSGRRASNIFLLIKACNFQLWITSKWQCSLHKIQLFHLISWYGNFVENHSFRRVSTKFLLQQIRWNSGILCNGCTLTNFYHRNSVRWIHILYFIPGIWARNYFTRLDFETIWPNETKYSKVE